MKTCPNSGSIPDEKKTHPSYLDWVRICRTEEGAGSCPEGREHPSPGVPGSVGLMGLPESSELGTTCAGTHCGIHAIREELL